MWCAVVLGGSLFLQQQSAGVESITAVWHNRRVLATSVIQAATEVGKNTMQTLATPATNLSVYLGLLLSAHCGSVPARQATHRPQWPSQSECQIWRGRSFDSPDESVTQSLELEDMNEGFKDWCMSLTTMACSPLKGESQRVCHDGTS